MNYVFKLGLSLLTHLRRQDFPVLGNKPLDRMELHSRGPYLLTCLNSTSSSSLLHGPFFIISNSLISMPLSFLHSTHHFHLYTCLKWIWYFCSCVLSLMATSCTCAREERYESFVFWCLWRGSRWHDLAFDLRGRNAEDSCSPLCACDGFDG